ncbi:dynamin family protein [Bacillus sp. CHD6a]|uniref:dynamin family protein n=1 Tax=Bacillus sp. CHD6a TaxID=1643452 RepID=UPI000761FCDE|nr:dynamin family protein [Bacillus sp. CHD6a]
MIKLIDESNSYKENWLAILYYFAKKYSSDFTKSRKLINNYASSIFSEQINESKFINQKYTQLKRNKFYIHRYKEYVDEFPRLVHEFVINPKHPIKLANEIDHLLERIGLNVNSKDGKLIKRIIVTATMSAGKSTLINALIGKKIMETKNESCTAKTYEIMEDPEAADVICVFPDKQVELNKDVATIIHNEANSNIKIRSSMYHIGDNLLWELIDTPGINSSVDPEHKQITHEMIKRNQFDFLLYVMNGNHLGSNDDLEHLQFISEHVDHSKIIFIINKVDQFRKEQDSIKTSFKQVVKQLKGLKFKKPKVFPLSAYASYLFKIELLGQTLDEEEEDELNLYKRKFNRKEWDLSSYGNYHHLQLIEIENILKQSGIANLEAELVGKDA